MKTILFTTNDQRSQENIENTISFLNDRHKGKQVDYIFQYKQNKPVRSVSQNSYYWVILQAIAATSGHTTDELHSYYAKKFNGKEIEGEVVGMTTTGLDTAEFSIYCKQVEEHGKSFFNAYISKPEDKHYAIWEQQTKDRYEAMFESI